MWFDVLIGEETEDWSHGGDGTWSLVDSVEFYNKPTEINKSNETLMIWLTVSPHRDASYIHGAPKQTPEM